MKNEMKVECGGKKKAKIMRVVGCSGCDVEGKVKQ